MVLSPLGAELAGLAAVGGAAIVGLGLVDRRRRSISPIAFLAEMDEADQVEEAEAGGSDYERRLRESILSRVLAPAVKRLVDRVMALAPRRYVDRAHQRLLVAGLSGRIRAEEFIALQVASVVVGLGLGAGLAIVLGAGLSTGLLVFLVLGAIGFLGPSSWVKRSTQARRDAIRKQLPDVLDLLAIAVEAGSGFEGAMAVACANFSSVLGDELTRTLKEMELGLPRRDALQNLKHRTDVPEMSNFVLALVQADALGMPIGPVLRAQGTELRVRRRQWARERAAKLPVKMLFPMVVFIFPSIFVVLLGPAATSILHVLKTLNG